MAKIHLQRLARQPCVLLRKLTPAVSGNLTIGCRL